MGLLFFVLGLNFVFRLNFLFCWNLIEILGVICMCSGWNSSLLGGGSGGKG